jgi:hypothetical protein
MKDRWRTHRTKARNAFRPRAPIPFVALAVGLNVLWVAPPVLGGSGLLAQTAQETFWDRLEELCGQAFQGTLIEAPDDDSWWDADRLVMHVRKCGEDEIRIPLHVDEDRSRTWVVSRTAAGLRLKHDHRLRDGTPDTTNTDYGGDTTGPGTIWRQEFPADAYSVGAVPGRASQLWYLELRPDDAFVYGLRREATGLRYRVEFDLTRPVQPPPPPWGFEDTGGAAEGSE